MMRAVGPEPTLGGAADIGTEACGSLNRLNVAPASKAFVLKFTRSVQAEYALREIKIVYPHVFIAKNQEEIHCAGPV